jgi:hypothetical protein
MPLDRLRAQAQLLCDRPSGAAVGDEQDDVLLDGRELCAGNGPPSFDRRTVAHGADAPLTRRPAHAATLQDCAVVDFELLGPLRVSVEGRDATPPQAAS